MLFPSNTYRGVQMTHNIPPRIVIPNNVNKQLSSYPSQQRMSQSNNKHHENVASIDAQNIGNDKMPMPITSTESPMIWFPGNSDCKDQDSGTEYRLNYNDILIQLYHLTSLIIMNIKYCSCRSFRWIFKYISIDCIPLNRTKYHLTFDK